MSSQATDVAASAVRSVVGTVHGGFEEQAARQGSKVAVKSGDLEISYAALNHTANRLAHLILERSGNSRQVALLYDSGPLALASMLAVLKAGKTYVPLDPTYPQARTTYMLE